MSSPFFSVVIPVFNTEKYLPQCLDSLLHQTQTDFQIILINDGSTDSSGQIGKNYAERYPEMITYLEQGNQGQGAARNYGLSLLSTPYVTFLDSDDWWLPRTAEYAIACIKENAPDLVFTCPIVYDTAKKGYSEWTDNKELRSIFSQNKQPLSPAEHPELMGTEITVCRLFAKTALLPADRKLFLEGIKWEDVFSHFYLIHNASSCMLIENAGFVYRINHGSQTTSSSEKSRLDIIAAFDPVFRQAIEEKWSPQEAAYVFRMFMTFVVWFLNDTDKNYYSLLVDKIHCFSQEVPGYFFSAYTRAFSSCERKSIILWLMIRHPAAYHLLKNSQYYDLLRIVAKRLLGVLHR